MSDFTPKSAVEAMGCKYPQVTLARAIGATGTHTEEALAAWFSEGFSAYHEMDRTRGGNSDDADVVRARAAGYETAMESEIIDD